ncbi:MAG: HAD family hydrolase [Candidatus Liptonbacteria bacterium]|nr:HAD family hydrolase [Candidatus Liptonbacteria bacterium]
MIKGILFDIDGVLIDSLHANTKFFQEILTLSGYRKPTKKDIAAAFHLPMWNLIQNLTLEESEERVWEIWKFGQRHPYPLHLLKAPVGANAIVRDLNKKYDLALVSSRSKRGIEYYFRFSKLKRYFKTFVCYEDTKNHKPHPDPLLLAAKRLNINPHECVYVGDSPTDVEAGRAAGMKTIWHGKRSPKLATAATSSFTHIPKIVSRLA